MKTIPSGLLFIKAKTACYLSELAQAKRVFSLAGITDKEKSYFHSEKKKASNLARCLLKISEIIRVAVPASSAFR